MLGFIGQVFEVLGLGVEECNLEIQTTHDHERKVAHRIPRYEELLKGLYGLTGSC